MENLYKKSKSKIIYSIFLIGLILVVTGVSYAFFAYYKTGLYTHTINGGKMNVIYDEVTGNNITIDNAYPLSDEEALSEAIEFEFTITGYNESEKNIYYAIEMDYGSEIENKERFKDTDMKLTLYENDELVMENEIFQNLDNQGIYFGYIHYGTSKESPTVNNYKLRIWINDNVYIHNAIDDDITLWDDYDWDWAEKHLDYDVLYRIYYSEITKLSEAGISIYNAEDFGTRYASFKVNVEANLSGDDIGILVYDANGGEYEPKVTSLATNMVTTQKPVLDGKGFLGWSTKKDGDEVDYFAGDYYSGSATTLYAVYSDTKNVMGTFPENILEYVGELDEPEEEASNEFDSFDYSIKQISEELLSDSETGIKEIYFINDLQSNIDERYNAAEVKADITYNNQGKVLAWLEKIDEYGNYILYVGAHGTVYFSDCVSLFSPFVNCTYINLANVDSSMITDMTEMFSIDYPDYGAPASNDNNDYKVEPLRGGGDNEAYMTIENLSSLNTSNVLKMNSMFEEIKCYVLDLSSFDTTNVVDMSYMFSDCYRLYDLDLRHFDTSNVTNMSRMFSGCDNLYGINLKNFNTSKVTDMSYMFVDCDWIDGFDFSNFDTSKVENMSGMFEDCDSIRELDVTNFDTSKVENMSRMFEDCYSIRELDVTNFDTSNVTDMSYMFDSLQYINSLDVSNFDTSKVENMAGMFSYCSELTNLDLSGFNTSNVKDMSYMFRNCNNLDTLDVSNFNMQNVTSTSYMFYRVPIKEVNLSNNDFSKVMDMSYMYSETLLEIVNMSNCTYNENVYITRMFDKCSNLVSLNFSDCVNLFTATFPCNSSSSTFNSIKYVDYSGSVFSSSVTSLSHGFAMCNNLTSVDFSNVNFNQITDLSAMFVDCPKLIEADLSGASMPEVNDMTVMFQDCSKLIKVSFEDSSMPKVADMVQMFRNCWQLETVDLSSFEFSRLSDYALLFPFSSKLIVYVKDETEQIWLITNFSGYFTTDNALIKTS